MKLKSEHDEIYSEMAKGAQIRKWRKIHFLFLKFGKKYIKQKIF
jgi:hypothetical protein